MKTNPLDVLLALANHTGTPIECALVEALLRAEDGLEWQVVALLSEKQDAVNMLPSLARALGARVRTSVWKDGPPIDRPRGVFVDDFGAGETRVLFYTARP